MGTLSYEHALNSITVSKEDKELAEKVLIDALATTNGSESNVQAILDSVLREILVEIDEALGYTVHRNAILNLDIEDNVRNDLKNACYAMDKIIGHIFKKRSKPVINKFKLFTEEYKDRLIRWYQYSLSRLPLFKYTRTVEDVNKRSYDMIYYLFNKKYSSCIKRAKKKTKSRLKKLSNI